MRGLLRGLFGPMLLVLAACSHEHSHDKIEATPYIVELRDDVDILAFIDEHYLDSAEPLFIIHGFSADLRPATVDTLRADDRVERLTEDHAVNAIAGKPRDDHPH